MNAASQMASPASSRLSASKLPSFDEMYSALCARDSHYEGVFVVGVKSTGIFCRPTCPARKPKPANVIFYPHAGDAIEAGFRACKRCRPLQTAEQTPPWVEELIIDIERDPSFRWTDERLKQRGIHPARLRRWFNRHYGTTFQNYQRKRRLSLAAEQIQGGHSVTHAAFDNGYESLSGFREAFQKWFGEVPCSVKASDMPLTLNRISTPLGPMVVGAVDDSICLLEFADRIDLELQFKKLVALTQRKFVTGPHELFDTLGRQLNEYFSGDRTGFNIPVFHPGSPFQQAVWQALLSIPFGQTRSYQQIANQVQRPGGQRAVGRANGSNRIAILIPCHRVVRSDGNPGGYAGELWRKQRLLDLERRNQASAFHPSES